MSRPSTITSLELGFLIAAAQSFACLFGYGFAWLAAEGSSSDVYRVTLIIEGGIARLRQIEIGHRDIRHAVVTRGLGWGSRIDLHPSDRFAHSWCIVELKSSN